MRNLFNPPEGVVRPLSLSLSLSLAGGCSDDGNSQLRIFRVDMNITSEHETTIRVQRVSSRLLGPVVLSFRALSGLPQGSRVWVQRSLVRCQVNVAHMRQGLTLALAFR